MDEQIEMIVREHGPHTKNLIPILQDVQEAFGYLPEGAISAVARLLRISEDTIYGVATFYSQFRFHRPGDHIIKVCLGTACFVKGAENLLEIVQSRLGIEPGQTTPDGRISLERVACLGCCALAPVVVVDDEVHGKLSPLKMDRLIDDLLKEGSSKASIGGNGSDKAVKGECTCQCTGGRA